MKCVLVILFFFSLIGCDGFGGKGYTPESRVDFKVLSIYPNKGDTDVFKNTSVMIEFNKDVEESTLKNNIIVSDFNNNVIKGRTVLCNKRIALFIPNEDTCFKKFTNYNINIRNIKSTEKNLYKAQ